MDGGGKGRRGMPKENRATSSVFDRCLCSRRRLFCQASNCPVNCFDTLIRSRESCQYAPTHHLDCRSLSTATWQRWSRSHSAVCPDISLPPTSRTLWTLSSLFVRSRSRQGTPLFLRRCARFSSSHHIRDCRSPTVTPSAVPTMTPTLVPTLEPSTTPTETPTKPKSTASPSNTPTEFPTTTPTASPSQARAGLNVA